MSAIKSRPQANNKTSPFVPDIKSTNTKTKITQLRQSSHVTTVVISTSRDQQGNVYNQGLDGATRSPSKINHVPIHRTSSSSVNVCLPRRNTEPVTLICSYQGCQQTFTDGHQFNLHLREHNGEKVYKCEWIECGRLFSNRQRLNDHVRFIHTKERPYKCNSCDKAFSSSKNLRAHRLLHTGERPHKCKWCGSRFRRSHHLTAHVRIHTGERPYPCEYPGCPLAFTKSDHSKRHYMTHFKVNKRKGRSSTIPMREKINKPIEDKPLDQAENPNPSLVSMGPPPDDFDDNFEINTESMHDGTPDLLSPMVLLDEKEGILRPIDAPPPETAVEQAT